MRTQYDRRDHWAGNHCWCRPRIENWGPVIMIHHRRVDPATLASRYEHIDEDDESSGHAALWVNNFGAVDDGD